MHQLTSRSLSLSNSLSAVHLLTWLSSPASRHYASLSLLYPSLPLFVLPLYSPPLPLSPTPHRRRLLCEWLSEKITLLLQTNSSFLFVVCCVRRGRDGKSGSGEICALLALKDAPPLRIQRRVSQQTAGPNGTTRLMPS